MAILHSNQGIRHNHLTVSDISLHYVEAGNGPAVVLLHGFPEFWYCWRCQLPFLAEHGLRAIAPDLRGYNLSSHPPAVGRYRMKLLVEDIAALIRQLDIAPAVLVGHDWGGVIAWRLAATYPQLVGALAILNAPHPLAFRRELRRNLGQWVRSAYAGFFQLPWLPERLLAAQDFALIRRGLRSAAQREGAFTDEDLAEYAKAFRTSALTGPLNYYRAARRYSGDMSDGPQAAPMRTLVIWGERDPALSTGLVEGLETWVPDLRLVRLPNAGHFVQHDAPGHVNELLLEFAGGA